MVPPRHPAAAPTQSARIALRHAAADLPKNPATRATALRSRDFSLGFRRENRRNRGRRHLFRHYLDNNYFIYVHGCIIK